MARGIVITMQKIPLNEITFEPASMIDDAGRVFRWNGHIYRAIKHEYADFYRELFTKKDIQILFGKGLVTSEIAPLSIDGYALVLKHYAIPFISYCMEWTSEMLRDAALLICDLAIELYAKGLTFKDAHPWNILFDFGQPIFVDWGSIGPVEQQREWPYTEFRDRFIFPLYLMSSGQSRLARTFMFDTVNRPRKGDIFRLLLRRVSLRTWLRYWLNDRRHMQARFKVDKTFFQSLRQTVESIPVTAKRTEWTEYEGSDGKGFSHQPSQEWPDKIRNVYGLLKALRPETFLDVGCNRGWFSELAALQGSQVVAIDIDEPSINTLYRRVRASKISVLPLVMDICTPTPPHGVMHARPQAQSRLRADLVLALALTHHLVFKRGLTFEAIAKQLASFTKKWLVVEFVPPDDQYVSKWMNDRFAWYRLEGFVSALQTFFKRIEVIDSSPSPRLLLFCEK